ncbi:hypothetical protein J6TS1_44020 [Siminovitchia terrae]|uniref:Uncharacterized protein n=1 Tax=Siminovitchia terrae TaxID=1914933 RepID=A0ABQ4L3G7_SIMTE|nr:hypothetical protein [Siminovitchia terrae]GIN98532.1 hypothetical protein J6TS1_44020 [Siminovitchia terrae]
MDIDDLTVNVGTSPSANHKKLDDGTAFKKDEIYEVSVLHNEAINAVHINYSYLGISFNDLVIFNETSQ